MNINEDDIKAWFLRKASPEVKNAIDADMASRGPISKRLGRPMNSSPFLSAIDSLVDANLAAASSEDEETEIVVESLPLVGIRVAPTDRLTAITLPPRPPSAPLRLLTFAPLRLLTFAVAAALFAAVSIGVLVRSWMTRGNLNHPNLQANRPLTNESPRIQASPPPRSPVTQDKKDFEEALTLLLDRLPGMSPEAASEARRQLLQDYPDHRAEIESHGVLAEASRQPTSTTEPSPGQAIAKNDTPKTSPPNREELELASLLASIAKYPADPTVATTSPGLRALWKQPELRELWQQVVRRAGECKDVRAASPELLALRRDVLRLRLEAFPLFTASKELRTLLDDTRPTTLAAMEGELKTQVARVMEDPRLKTTGTEPTQKIRLLCVLPPGLREGSINLYDDVQRFARSRNGKLDPVLADYLTGTRRPGDQLGMIIPACFPLSDDAGKERWNQLLGLDWTGVPVRVVVRYGVQTEMPEPDYSRAFTLAKQRGLGLLGYVNCDGGGRKLADVQYEVNRWYRLYPGLILGIFFDNQPPVADGRLGYFADLFASVRKLDPGAHIVSSTTAACDEDCLTKTGANVMFRFGKPDDLGPKGWEAKYDPSRFAVMIREVDNPTPARLQSLIDRSIAAHFGWIYVADREGFPEKSFEFVPDYLQAEAGLIRNTNAEIAGRPAGAATKGAATKKRGQRP